MKPETKKALYIFLGLTFGLTVVISATARLIGFTFTGTPALMSQMVVLGAMFIPAVSAIVTQKFMLKKQLRELGFKLGPLSMYAKTYGIILLIFIINYGFTWIFIQKPDLSLGSFLSQYLPGQELPMPAPLMLAIVAMSTFLVVPFFNLLPSLGEEIGWRGFFGDQMWPGVLLHFTMVSGLGIWMAYIWLRTRSTILAAFMHATFNANAYGIWSMVFVSDSKLVI